jgi:hypothetical protein
MADGVGTYRGRFRNVVAGREDDDKFVDLGDSFGLPDGMLEESAVSERQILLRTAEAPGEPAGENEARDFHATIEQIFKRRDAEAQRCAEDLMNASVLRPSASSASPR